VIEEVYVDGVPQGKIDTYTFTNVSKDHTISSVFVLNKNASSTGSLTAPSDSLPNRFNTENVHRVSMKSIRLVPGATETANVICDGKAYENVVWTIGDPEIASVDENGVVAGLSIGTTTLTASSDMFERITCTVTVSESIVLKDIYLTERRITTAVGSSYSMECSLYPETASAELYWYSSDESVATVDPSGTVTVHSEGFAVITVTAIEGTSLFYDDCIVVTENSADYGIMLYAPEITAGIYGLRVHGIVPNNSEKSYLVCAAVYEQGIMKTCTLEEFSAETLRSGDVELSLDYASLPDTFDLKLFLFDSASGVPAAEPYQTN